MNLQLCKEGFSLRLTRTWTRREIYSQLQTKKPSSAFPGGYESCIHWRNWSNKCFTGGCTCGNFSDGCACSDSSYLVGGKLYAQHLTSVLFSFSWWMRWSWGRSCSRVRCWFWCLGWDDSYLTEIRQHLMYLLMIFRHQRCWFSDACCITWLHMLCHVWLKHRFSHMIFYVCLPCHRERDLAHMRHTRQNSASLNLHTREKWDTR